MTSAASAPDPNTRTRRKVRHIPSLAGWKDWILDLDPAVFVTITAPTMPKHADQRFLSLWTLDVERYLYGSSSLRIDDISRRIRWFFVRETSIHKRNVMSKRPAVLKHFHGYAFLPDRPTRKEHELNRQLSRSIHAALMSFALRASVHRTPEPFRGATRDDDVNVVPIDRPKRIVNYGLKDRRVDRLVKLDRDHRETVNLMIDHGLMIFPLKTSKDVVCPITH